MEYLNENYPYTRSDAIACFYSYEKTCILKGLVNEDKKLIICEELNFEKKSVTFVAEYLNTFTGKCWINKNPYLANLLGSCYFLDFEDEQDCCQLEDLFKSLIAEDRIVFNGKKPLNSNREKTLPILIKALSHSLFFLASQRCGRAIASNDLKNTW
jgi:hypothetical protein